MTKQNENDSVEAATSDSGPALGCPRPALTSPAYVFREGVEPLAYQVWRSDDGADFIHESCATTPSEREFPLYADDLAAAQCGEPVYCAICDALIDEASDLLSRATEWVSIYDATVAGGGGMARDTEQLYGRTRKLIADLAAAISTQASATVSAHQPQPVASEVLQPDPDIVCGNCSEVFHAAPECQPSPASPVSAIETLVSRAAVLSAIDNYFAEMDAVYKPEHRGIARMTCQSIQIAVRALPSSPSPVSADRLYAAAYKAFRHLQLQQDFEAENTLCLALAEFRSALDSRPAAEREEETQKG